MYKDLEMTWEGEFPYDILAPAGITPDSTIREIQRCIGYFAKQGLAGQVQNSRSLLKQINKRLFFDFFFYRRELPGMNEKKSNSKEEHR